MMVPPAGVFLNSATSPSKNPEINRVKSDLAARIQYAEEKTAMLMERVDQVLAQVDSKAQASAPRQACNTPLGRDLDALLLSTERICGRLDSILERLEL
jgi:hypothetical protein